MGGQRGKVRNMERCGCGCGCVHTCARVILHTNSTLPSQCPICRRHPFPPPSYKPQKISPKFDGTVRQLLHKKIRESYMHPQFQSDVMKPMNIEVLMDQEVQNLSGGLGWGEE